MKDDTKGEHGQGMHRPRGLKISPREEVHGPTQSTSRTPIKSQAIQRAKAEVMSCIWIDRKNRNNACDPKDQFQGNASQPVANFFHDWESTKKVPAHK